MSHTSIVYSYPQGPHNEAIRWYNEHPPSPKSPLETAASNAFEQIAPLDLDDYISYHAWKLPSSLVSRTTPIQFEAVQRDALEPVSRYLKGRNVLEIGSGPLDSKGKSVLSRTLQHQEAMQLSDLIDQDPLKHHPHFTPLDIMDLGKLRQLVQAKKINTLVLKNVFNAVGATDIRNFSQKLFAALPSQSSVILIADKIAVSSSLSSVFTHFYPGCLPIPCNADKDQFPDNLISLPDKTLVITKEGITKILRFLEKEIHSLTLSVNTCREYQDLHGLLKPFSHLPTERKMHFIDHFVDHANLETIVQLEQLLRSCITAAELTSEEAFEESLNAANGKITDEFMQAAGFTLSERALLKGSISIPRDEFLKKTEGLAPTLQSAHWDHRQPLIAFSYLLPDTDQLKEGLKEIRALRAKIETMPDNFEKTKLMFSFGDKVKELEAKTDRVTSARKALESPNVNFSGTMSYRRFTK